MEEKPPRSSLKRPLLDDDDPLSGKAPPQKRVRFPKGRKVKPGDEASVKRPVEEDEGPVDLTDPRLAAKERAKHRNQMTTDLFSDDNRGIANDISAAEVAYEEDENFEDDGIQLEPFNLNKEREEGYFDAEGNFVEYVHEKEIKDAWLDSVEAKITVASRRPRPTTTEDNDHELSADDIGKIKRRIADTLNPGETVLQALRRLKGSTNRKEKMSPESKSLFEQLTEDANVLLGNGEYDVYQETQEVFEREAEGYERLAWARDGGTTALANNGNSHPVVASNILPEGIDASSAPFRDIAAGTSENDASIQHASNGATDEYDMFAEDDEQATSDKASEAIGHIPEGDVAVAQPSSSAVTADPNTGDSQSDYIYDEASGYYYSSSLGYYYDPTTKLYCSATSGQWYSFNEETGTYEEVSADVSNES